MELSAWVDILFGTIIVLLIILVIQGLNIRDAKKKIRQGLHLEPSDESVIGKLKQSLEANKSLSDRLKMDNASALIKMEWHETNNSIAGVGGWLWTLAGEDADSVEMDALALRLFDVKEGVHITAAMLVGAVFHKDRENIATEIIKARETGEDYKIYYRRFFAGKLYWIECHGKMIRQNIEGAPVITHIRGTVQVVREANETDEFYAS